MSTVPFNFRTTNNCHTFCTSFWHPTLRGWFATLGAQRPIRVSENIITSLTGIWRNHEKVTCLSCCGDAAFTVLAGIAYAATGVTDPVVLSELAQVRQATAKYHDVNAALADGFVPTPHCIQEPGLGGMGIHYIHPARLMDPEVNILEPEILLYVESGNGLKLLGSNIGLASARLIPLFPTPPLPRPSFLADRSMVLWRRTSRADLRTMTYTPGSGRQIPLASLPRSTRMSAASDMSRQS